MDEDNLTPVSEAPQEDKVNEQISETSNPVNNEAPDTNQGEEETGINGEDKADKLLAGTFKSTEELERAYKELRTKATKDAMQKAELAKTVNNTLSEQTEGLYGDDHVAVKLDAMERSNAVNSFTITHPDANVAEVDSILRSDPVVQSIGTYEGRLEYAYLKSQNMATQKAVEEAGKKAAVQKEAKILEKQAAQVESSRKAEPEQDTDLLTQASTGSYEQREAARRELIRKHLINL